MTKQEGPLTTIKASAFVNPIYSAVDDKSAEIVESLMRELGIAANNKNRICVSSVIAACQVADSTDSPLIAFPMNATYYLGKQCGYKAASAVLKALLSKNFLSLHTERERGRARCYTFSGLDLSGKYSSKILTPVEVRKTKPHPTANAKPLNRRECIRKFPTKFLQEECRIQKINGFLSEHKLESRSGVLWGGVTRTFNNGRMDHGGRLYGNWQTLKEKDRLDLLIDGEEVVEIDVTACFLFIASAKQGQNIAAIDPYSLIPWVEDKNTRALAKRLINTILFKATRLTRFSKGLREEFQVPRSHSISDYTTGIFSTFPFLETDDAIGFSAMFEESETILSAIETLRQRDVAAFPVHDCIIVNKHHTELAAAVLIASFKSRYNGSAPGLTIESKDGAISFREIDINQEMVDELVYEISGT